MNLNEFSTRFISNEFQDSSVKKQIEAGWREWSCENTSLPAKTKKLGNKVIQLMKSHKMNPEKTYVLFKNILPLKGRDYDYINFVDIETDHLLYTIVPSSGHESTKGQAQVWGRENFFQKPLVAGTWKDIKDFFNVK
jgi:hypothetical protein